MERYKITWAPSALRDFKVAFDYISLDRPQAAQNWVSLVLKSIEKLARFPKIGRLIPEIGQSRYRELIVGEYRIFHEVAKKEVQIFRVLHSKRHWP